jgi:hypothetical protein
MGWNAPSTHLIPTSLEHASSFVWQKRRFDAKGRIGTRAPPGLWLRMLSEGEELSPDFLQHIEHDNRTIEAGR